MSKVFAISWMAMFALVALAHSEPAVVTDYPLIPQETAKEIKAAKEATRTYEALVKRLNRIKALSMTMSGRGQSVKVVFPPPRRAKAGEVSPPKTIVDCFADGLTAWAGFDHIRSGKFEGEQATILEHFPRDGADAYTILYISKKTGWPLACGYSLDTAPPMLSKFMNLRVTLKRDKSRILK